MAGVFLAQRCTPQENQSTDHQSPSTDSLPQYFIAYPEISPELNFSDKPGPHIQDIENPAVLVVAKPPGLPAGISSQIDTTGGIVLLIDGDRLQPVADGLGLQTRPASPVTYKDVYDTMREIDVLLGRVKKGDGSALGETQQRVLSKRNEIAAKLKGTSHEARRQLSDFVGRETFDLLASPEPTSFDDIQKAWKSQSRRVKMNWLGLNAQFKIGTEGAELRLRRGTVSLRRLRSVPSTKLPDAIDIDLDAFKKFKSSKLTEAERKEIAYIDYVGSEIISRQKTTVNDNVVLSKFEPNKVSRNGGRISLVYQDHDGGILTLWLDGTRTTTPQVRGELSRLTHRKAIGFKELVLGAKFALRARSIRNKGKKILADGIPTESLALSESPTTQFVIQTEHTMLLPQLADAQNALAETVGGPTHGTTRIVEVSWEQPVPCWFIAKAGDLVLEQTCELSPIQTTSLLELVPQ